MQFVYRLRGLSFPLRIGILVAVALLGAIVTFSIDAFPQPAWYHNFADQRMIQQIPSAFNVVSNAGFGLIGLLGLFCLATGRAIPAMQGRGSRTPYVFFFAGFILVAIGSGYYHYGPETETLYWDRAAMSFAFMALYAAIIGDRINRLAGLILLPILIFVGVALTTSWAMSELNFTGDLRLYLLVQVIPASTIPLIILLFEDRLGRDRYFIAMLVVYGLAMVLENLDRQIYEALGQSISGHSLKHLVAAAAGYLVLHRMLVPRSAPR